MIPVPGAPDGSGGESRGVQGSPRRHERVVQRPAGRDAWIQGEEAVGGQRPRSVGRLDED
jgi:hypothetical protein